jgi:hypothetical protein
MLDIKTAPPRERWTACSICKTLPFSMKTNARPTDKSCDFFWHFSEILLGSFELPIEAKADILVP